MISMQEVLAMKKIIILASTLILLLALAGIVQAATQEIAVNGVLGSSNATATAPVQYLTDGNPGTAWISGQTTGSAWAVLQLVSPVLIDGLQIYGPWCGELTVEYWQNGGWHTFLAASHLKAETFRTGWNLLDLSYDRIVTNQMRIWLDNPQQLNQIGGIGEVKVLGRTGQDVLERLEPVAVTSNRKSENNCPVDYIFDHNTYSSWWFNRGTPANGEAVADLGEICNVQRIKIFGSNDGNGQFKLQYLSGGNWFDIPGASNLSIKQIGAAWQSIELPSWINTSQIKVVFNSTQKVGGLREIEIWGHRTTPTGSNYLENNRASLLLNSDTAANYTFSIASQLSDPAILHVITEGTSTTPLTWELNGQDMGSLNPAATVRGLTINQQTIAPYLLNIGVNFIRIKGAGLTVRDCKLEISYAHILTFSGSFSDRLLLTPVDTGSQVIDLGGTYHLNELVLTYLGNQPQVQIAIDQDGSWVPLSGLPGYNTGVVGGELIYTTGGINPVHRIKVDFSAGPDGPTEITIHGSRINDGAPQVKIFSPINGTLFSNLTTWGQAYITGIVDNPDCTVRVNGQGMTLNGTSFKVPLPVAGNPDSNKTIQVVATDAQGRTGSDQVSVIISNPPDFTVNLPDQLIYTSQSQITVTGQVVVPQSKVTINGVTVTLSNLNFTEAVSLNEGLNLITIKVMPPGNPQWATIQRRVVRTGNPPYLNALYPVDSQIVNVSQITVSGQVSSLIPVTVIVNNQAATVNGGNFSSSPVSLVEGNNTITIIATDQNGLTSKVTLTVKRDSTKPTLSITSPADGAAVNTASITVTGKVSDASPVSVLVNGSAATISEPSTDGNKQFTASANLSEGWNTLTANATDVAGNTNTLSQKILLDTVPPLTFTPTADISGWSNNNKPTISFSTTDASSGIDHYEIAVDDGSFVTPVSSPYKFTSAIPEGEHTIHVKAFDKAGNSTTGDVKVAIDTVPPAIPAGYEVISGIGRVIINWQDPKGEIVGYRITRNPVFSDGAFKDLSRDSETIALNQFIDYDVTSGAKYTYTLKALDHAGNYSPATEAVTVTVGVTSQQISSEGGTVKFDNCVLTLDEGAITKQGQIIVKQTTEDLPDNDFATKTGTPYSFVLLDQEGREVTARFNKQVILTISYADMQLPQGFEYGDLGVYWYNKNGGYWEKVGYSQNDQAEKTIKVPLIHFSDYQVMASKYTAPSLDSYYSLGVSPFQSYFQDNTEYVSPAYGNLSISATDLRLPGRNGFDLVIKRIYDSDAAQQQRISEKTRKKGPVDTFGCGWTLNIPWIESNIFGKFIRLPEGQTIQIELDASGCFKYHKGVHFVLQSNNWDNPRLIMNDGTQYEFDSQGRVTSETDPSGMNTIKFSYNGRQLDTITDSIGRVVKFHYISSGSKMVIDKISVGPDPNSQRTITYNYRDDYLTDVYDPLKRHTIYAYEPHPGLLSTEYGGYYDVDLLNSITYPTGGVSYYTYETRTQESYYTAGKKILVSGHRLTNISKSMDKVTSYLYVLNDKNGYTPSNKHVTSCTVTEGNKVTDLKFNLIVGDDLIDSNVNGYWYYCYEGNLMVSSRTTIENSREYEQVSYHYDVPLRAVNDEIHYRNNERKYEITYAFDNWGNTIYRFDSSRNLKEEWTYHPLKADPKKDPAENLDRSRIRNLVDTATKTNVNPVNGTKTVLKVSHIYDEELGKPLSITVNDGNRDMVTTYTYYTQQDGNPQAVGNLKSQTEPNGLETEFVYDGYGFLKSRISRAVKDADEKTTDIETDSVFNWWGLKVSETDPNKKITNYKYDDLNRVWLVTLPDDDGDPANNPYREYKFYDDPGDKERFNTCEFTNENKQLTIFRFDSLGRLTEIDKNSSQYQKDLKTVYDYDNLGRIEKVTDPLGNVTNYFYDGINRVIEVDFPKSNNPGVVSTAVNLVAKLDYSDTDNRVTIVEHENTEGGIEEIGRTEETSDWANRLIGAVQSCEYSGGTQKKYYWQFSYDSLGNKVQQSDPLFSQTDQTFDVLGHLTKVQLPSALLVNQDNAEPVEVRPELKYEYDNMGRKTAETDARGNRIEYGYDELGRVITVTTKSTDHITNQQKTTTLKNYYDAAGNKIKVVDGNLKRWDYTYSARGWLLSEKDPLGNVTRYRYDAMGNKVSVTDPRNKTGYKIIDDKVVLDEASDNRTYTTWYIYDDLNRLTKTVFPDGTPPNDIQLKEGGYDNPYTEVSYDENGNKLSERDLNGVLTEYTYTPRNQVETIKINGKLKTRYTYDAEGNPIITESVTKDDGILNFVTNNSYDSLGRLRKTVLPKTSEVYDYDAVGNKTDITDGMGYVTHYEFNSLGWLTSILDPLNNLTKYQYDPNGNRVKVIAANDQPGNRMITFNYYDEMNRIYKTVDTLGKATVFSYDDNGNRKWIVDRRGSTWEYHYENNNLLKRLDVKNGNDIYYIEYTYDEAGNRKTVTDSSNIVNYNYSGGIYQSDPLNRITSIDRTFDSGNANYRTEYQYNPVKPTLLAGIKYPEAKNPLQYNYDNQNRVNEVVGFTQSQGISYNADDTLQKINYANGVTASFNYDAAQRLQDLTVNGSGVSIMEQHYTYKVQTNNIETINDGKITKTFTYDADNQLIKSITPGKFMESDPASGSYGLKVGDFSGAFFLDFSSHLTGMMRLDFNSSSIGIDFGSAIPGVKKILIIPDASITTHRVTQRTLDLYTSTDNSSYTLIPRNNWSYAKDSKGVITLTLTESLATRYLKIHVKFDERNADFSANDKAKFLNDLAKMLQVYQEATSRTEEFVYDAAGNRTLQRVTLVNTKDYSSGYYKNSDRLKTDGKFAFVYDDAGNLVEKGNKFNINDDNVTFTATSGEGVEYWQYTYDLLNRLTEVSKNGTVVADYEYSPDGLREVKRAKGITTHYVFEGTEPIFEKRISDGRIRSYVYALGKHLARVDGVIGEQTTFNPDGTVLRQGKPTYFYHTDQVGSVKAVTDQSGKVVFNADYFAFGTKYTSNGDFDETHGFTGKEYDSDTGLYYYNARWYDSELGRFISEDSANDPNSPNLYCYGSNNPLSFIDPTGHGVMSPEAAEHTMSEFDNNDGSSSGPSSSPTLTSKYDKDGRLKKSIIDDSNKRTTVYWNKDGTINHVSTIDFDAGISTLTYFHKDGTIATTTFGQNGGLIGYSKQAISTVEDNSNSSLLDFGEGPLLASIDDNVNMQIQKSWEEAKYKNTTIGIDHTAWYWQTMNTLFGPVGDAYMILTNGDMNPITGRVYLPRERFNVCMESFYSAALTWLGGSYIFGTNISSTAILKNGYYEVNGFRFSERYFNKLWDNGRGGASLIAKEILLNYQSIAKDKQIPGFYRLVYNGWEMVYNFGTKEVWHIMPIDWK